VKNVWWGNNNVIHSQRRVRGGHLKFFNLCMQTYVGQLIQSQTVRNDISSLSLMTIAEKYGYITWLRNQKLFTFSKVSKQRLKRKLVYAYGVYVQTVEVNSRH
jgi:hypothetical protein